MKHRPYLRVAWPVTLASAFALGILAQAHGLIGDMLSRWDDMVFLTGEHVFLVAVSGGLATAVGIPLGIALSRPRARRVAEALMQVLNIGTTIPTLAVLALSMSFLGIGKLPAIFALGIASLLPIVRNTYAGILQIEAHLIEAAIGMGMRPWQILLRIELPNALLVIFAGIRTALTLNVGTAPLAFLIGGGGLGELIFTGISMNEPGIMLAGAIPTAVLAVITDFLVSQSAFWLVPRGINPLR